MAVLEICLYQRGALLQRDVGIREMSVLERDIDIVDVCIRDVCIRDARCLCQKTVLHGNRRILIVFLL